MLCRRPEKKNNRYYVVKVMQSNAFFSMGKDKVRTLVLVFFATILDFNYLDAIEKEKRKKSSSVKLLIFINVQIDSEGGGLNS